MSDVLAALRDPATIRLRSAAITRAVEQGLSGWFALDRRQLPVAAARVADVIRRRHPDLVVPLHSRWRHFGAGGVDRKAELDDLLAGISAAERARAQVDLTVVSVLLDAGAGAQWRYVEHAGIDRMALPPQRQRRHDLLAMLDQAAGGIKPAAAAEAVAELPAELPAQAPVAAPAPPSRAATYARSEGLAVASFRAFVAGAFSSQPDAPCRADADALKLVDATALRALFQASPSNALVGLEGRAGLLARLGQALQHEHSRDGVAARPSLVVDRVTAGFTRTEVSATELLQELLRSFASIWTSGSSVRGLPAGDVWPHRWAGADTGLGPDPHTAGWVPFHKLSQWLTYSLIEPLQWAGVQVTGQQALTGLPEYRNGGLLLDTGVIVPGSPRDLQRHWKAGDEFVVEWRALTLTLLDELALLVRAELGADEQQMPLACILEGGTWAAGRELAMELRGGAPPLTIDSDGTVF